MDMDGLACSAGVCVSSRAGTVSTAGGNLFHAVSTGGVTPDGTGGDAYVRMDGQATGFRGGLYPNGSNKRPAQHEAAGLDLSRQIQPLATDGRVDDQNGRILFISIGMSNTATEFGAFSRLAEQKAELNPKVVLLNGALPNQIAERWSNPEGIA